MGLIEAVVRPALVTLFLVACASVPPTLTGQPTGTREPLPTVFNTPTAVTPTSTPVEASPTPRSTPTISPSPGPTPVTHVLTVGFQWPKSDVRVLGNGACEGSGDWEGFRVGRSLYVEDDGQQVIGSGHFTEAVLTADGRCRLTGQVVVPEVHLYCFHWREDIGYVCYSRALVNNLDWAVVDSWGGPMPGRPD